eukprot:m.42920 g.42920  ORF g.42920 m.42920 type:complete len:97 (+) comp10536_c0_seq1:153-443(+)
MYLDWGSSYSFILIKFVYLFYYCACVCLKMREEFERKNRKEQEILEKEVAVCWNDLLLFSRLLLRNCCRCLYFSHYCPSRCVFACFNHKQQGNQEA